MSVLGSNITLINENDEIIGERLYPENHIAIKKIFLYTRTTLEYWVKLKMTSQGVCIHYKVLF